MVTEKLLQKIVGSEESERDLLRAVRDGISNLAEMQNNKLNKGGVIIGDDISWNSSVWDFADQYNAPSFNYKGTVDVAFF